MAGRLAHGQAPHVDFLGSDAAHGVALLQAVWNLMRLRGWCGSVECRCFVDVVCLFFVEGM